ncbi:MAG: flavin reductase family protein [Bacteroidales bacterium]|nr:flavin reductase family protein [Bacteroidales bacterium]
MSKIQYTKQRWKGGNLIYPLPALMVSCGNELEGYNIITVSWGGTVCTNPPMCSISIRPERYSYDIIKKSGEFVVNLSTAKLAKATDWCGVKSGREVNKFEAMNLTPMKASEIEAPLIMESPVNLECKVKQIIPLGSHDLFLSEILAVNVNTDLIDPKTEKLMLYKAGLIHYSHGFYYRQGEKIGQFGFSVKKKK